VSAGALPEVDGIIALTKDENLLYTYFAILNFNQSGIMFNTA